VAAGAVPEGVKIFLVLGDASPMYRKQRFAGIFQRAELSAFGASTVGEDFGTLLAPDAAVTVETAQCASVSVSFFIFSCAASILTGWSQIHFRLPTRAEGRISHQAGRSR
jgi:hypothetical protein